MILKIKLIDSSLPNPSYQTKGSVAFDLYSRIDIIIHPNQPTIIPLNLIAKIPKGYFLMLAARSSLALKKSLFLANGIGVIDQDYHGENDEIKASVINFSQKPVLIKRGERVVQALLVKIGKVKKFVKLEKTKKKSRGGFGSTQ